MLLFITKEKFGICKRLVNEMMNFQENIQYKYMIKYNEHFITYHTPIIGEYRQFRFISEVSRSIFNKAQFLLTSTYLHYKTLLYITMI